MKHLEKGIILFKIFPFFDDQEVVDSCVVIRLKSTKDNYRLEDEYLSNVIMTIKVSMTYSTKFPGLLIYKIGTTLFFELSQDRIRNIKEIPKLCEYFFVNPNYSSQESQSLRKIISNEILKSTSDLILKKLSDLKDDESEFQIDNIKSIIQNIILQTGYKQREVLMSLRYIITGIKVNFYLFVICVNYELYQLLLLLLLCILLLGWCWCSRNNENDWKRNLFKTY